MHQVQGLRHHRVPGVQGGAGWGAWLGGGVRAGQGAGRGGRAREVEVAVSWEAFGGLCCVQLRCGMHANGLRYGRHDNGLGTAPRRRFLQKLVREGTASPFRRVPRPAPAGVQALACPCHTTRCAARRGMRPQGTGVLPEGKVQEHSVKRMVAKWGQSVGLSSGESESDFIVSNRWERLSACAGVGGAQTGARGWCADGCRDCGWVKRGAGGAAV